MSQDIETGESFSEGSPVLPFLSCRVAEPAQPQARADPMRTAAQLKGTVPPRSSRGRFPLVHARCPSRISSCSTGTKVWEAP